MSRRPACHGGRIPASRESISRTHWPRVIGPVVVAALLACTARPVLEAAVDVRTVADSPSRARAPDGRFISWVEHLIDAEDVNGGLPIRGGDGLALADLDGDGFVDIVTAQEDSNHLRVAFGSADPDAWVLRTIASGEVVSAIEDVAVVDLDANGWPDLVAACEDAHLVYFENPGERSATRRGNWPALIPPNTVGRGSWLRVFAADVTGDGRPDLLAANKGTADLVRPEAGDPAEGPTSLFVLNGPPSDPASWSEQVLMRDGIPNTALPIDIDRDGDVDVLAAARNRQQMFLLENLGLARDGTVEVRTHAIRMRPAFAAPPDWRGLSNAFQAEFADLDGDGRPDLVVNVLETGSRDDRMQAGLGWLAQPESLDQPWRFHRIGSTLPDWVIGIHLADLDGDGDLDAVTGGYSGVNIVDGAYSGASRDFDEPSVTAASSVARIAWFENPGDAAGVWIRHDISRRVRGMYDMFASRDMDGDGDLDLVAPRGNSGAFDGVFWLEQVRSEVPRAAFTPARSDESRPLPLPPEDWQERYGRGVSFVAPNKSE